MADDFINFSKEIESQLAHYSPNSKFNVTCSKGLLRTCISRSYFAAFIYARKITNLENVRRNIHRKVINKLRSMGKTGEANLLWYLRDKRNCADYNLNFKFNANDVSLIVKTAITLINLLTH